MNLVDALQNVPTVLLPLEMENRAAVKKRISPQNRCIA
jgi:hypothetical protein